MPLPHLLVFNLPATSKTAPFDAKLPKHAEGTSAYFLVVGRIMLPGHVRETRQPQPPTMGYLLIALFFLIDCSLWLRFVVFSMLISFSCERCVNRGVMVRGLAFEVAGMISTVYLAGMWYSCFLCYVRIADVASIAYGTSSAGFNDFILSNAAR